MKWKDESNSESREWRKKERRTKKRGRKKKGRGKRKKVQIKEARNGRKNMRKDSIQDKRIKNPKV